MRKPLTIPVPPTRPTNTIANPDAWIAGEEHPPMLTGATRHGEPVTTEYPAPQQPEGPAGPLTQDEIADLITAEAVIERGRQVWEEVGNALLEIRNRRLYRESDGTFEAYLNRRWNFSRGRGYQLIAAATVAGALSTQVDIHPENERQLRPLARLAPPQQAPAWDKAVTMAGGGQPTPEQVRAAAETIAPRKPPEPTFTMGASVWWREEPSQNLRTGTVQLVRKPNGDSQYGVVPTDGGGPAIVYLTPQRMHGDTPPEPPAPHGKCSCGRPFLPLGNDRVCPHCTPPGQPAFAPGQTPAPAQTPPPDTQPTAEEEWNPWQERLDRIPDPTPGTRHTSPRRHILDRPVHRRSPGRAPPTPTHRPVPMLGTRATQLPNRTNGEHPMTPGLLRIAQEQGNWSELGDPYPIPKPTPPRQRLDLPEMRTAHNAERTRDPTMTNPTESEDTAQAFPTDDLETPSTGPTAPDLLRNLILSIRERSQPLGVE